MPLPPGPYETLITEEIDALLAALPPSAYATARLGPEWMEDALARHVGHLVLRHLRGIAAAGDAAGARVEAARAVLDALAGRVPEAVEPSARPAARGDALTWIAPPAVGPVAPAPPLLPLHGLVHPSFLFNGRTDVSLLGELVRELATADQVDAVVAFLKRSGLRLLLDPLRRFRERAGPDALRLITTTYTGATEADAVDTLASLGFAVKVAREEDATRLHAKAWCFRRASGLSTVYVGSSNLSHSAMVDGAEWNVRVTQALTPALLERFDAAFGQLWGELGPCYRPGADADALRAALARARGEAPGGGARVVRLGARPKPHQERVLAELAAERRCGHTRNLVVAATGTGKTWIAAFDFQRLQAEHGSLRLLFVAHRREILTQSLQVYRDVLGDPGFGELWVGGERPRRGTHVFASVQSWDRAALGDLPRDTFDVVVIDELHHAAAASYATLVEHLAPRWLLGLTATPERADGKSVLGWFDHRFASETRLGAALAAGLLVPFHYLGVADGTDGSRAWTRGRVDLAALERVVTGSDLQANRVIDAVRRHVDADRMRALGFCVGVGHAEGMARAFRAAGLPAVAVHADTPDAARREALAALQAGGLRAVFTVDLLNEGVDLPATDTLLFLRPTESATVVLQQLGRGLRHHPGKAVLTVLDFVGQLHRDFRWEVRFAALAELRTRREVIDALEAGFPRLPPGCAIQLEPAARELVLTQLRQGARASRAGLVRALEQLGPATPLAGFLDATGATLEDVYAHDRGWTRLRRDAGFEGRPPGPDEPELQKRLGRLLHADDPTRLDAWRRWAASVAPPAPSGPDEEALAWMLFAALGDRSRPVAEIPASLARAWAHAPIREELAQLLDVLAAAPRRERGRLDGAPVHLHARYTRDEIVAAWRVTANGRLRELREGVLWVEAARTDLLFVTLDKSEQHRPQLRYADYPVDPRTFHWESQNGTSGDRGVGLRYVRHATDGTRVVLFVREREKEPSGRTLPYACLGPARYRSHQGARPMQILWALDTPMPAALFEAGRATA